MEAEKEIDYLDEKESKFEKAKAIIQGMILSGDNVFLEMQFLSINSFKYLYIVLSLILK